MSNDQPEICAHDECLLVRKLVLKNFINFLLGGLGNFKDTSNLYFFNL